MRFQDLQDASSPLEITEAGGLKTVGGVELLRQRVIRLLFTTPGELLHRPNWGVGLQKYAHKPASVKLMQRVANAARSGLEAVPWIDEVSVSVYKGSDVNSVMLDVKASAGSRRLRVEGIDLNKGIGNG